MNKWLIVGCITFLLFTGVVFPQKETKPTPIPGMRGGIFNLPDISVIGDIVNKMNVRNEFSKNELFVREIELALQGYIYPEMKADVFLAMHREGDNEEAEIDEAYVSFLNLFNAFTLIAGKKYIDFGKINKIHQHERPYVDQPSVFTNFFGEHAFVGEGASLDFLLPLPFFAKFTSGVWRIPAVDHGSESEEPDEFGLRDIVYSGRIWISFPLFDISELELGGSTAIGKGFQFLEHMDNVKVYGLDLTYKFWPSAYEQFLLQSEFFNLIREIPDEKLIRYGFYTFIGYRFNKYLGAGIRYDWTENAIPEIKRTNNVSGVITNFLTETTMLRLQYGYNFDKESHEVYLQFVFGIGPHAHPLQ